MVQVGRLQNQLDYEEARDLAGSKLSQGPAGASSNLGSLAGAGGQFAEPDGL